MRSPSMPTAQRGYNVPFPPNDILSNFLWPQLSNILSISELYLGHILIIPWPHLEDILRISSYSFLLLLTILYKIEEWTLRVKRVFRHLEEYMLIKLYKSNSQFFLTNNNFLQELVSNGEKNG